MLIEHLQRATLNNDTSVGYTLWIPSTSLFMKDAASFKQVWWAFDPRALILVVRKSHIASRNQSHLTLPESSGMRSVQLDISIILHPTYATDVTCVFEDGFGTARPVVPLSRSRPVVPFPLSRCPVVPLSRCPVVPLSRCPVVPLAVPVGGQRAAAWRTFAFRRHFGKNEVR